MNNYLFERDVRIPVLLLEQLQRGEIAAAMLVTMNILYKLANWKTGRVRHISANGLSALSAKAFSSRTFSEALRNLEWMRWITRHMVSGSHKDYSVTIHNYKWVDDEGKVHILNQTEIKVCTKFPKGRCEEASDETSWEASDEGSDETSDKVLSLHLSSNKSQLESQHKSEHDSQHVSSGAAAPVAGFGHKGHEGRISPEPKAICPPVSETPSPDSELKVAGYSMTTIREHVQKLIDSGDGWVEENATDDALHRPGFVQHVMTLEPKKKRTKTAATKSGKHEPVYAGFRFRKKQVEI